MVFWLRLSTASSKRTSARTVRNVVPASARRRCSVRGETARCRANNFSLIGECTLLRASERISCLTSEIELRRTEEILRQWHTVSACRTGSQRWVAVGRSPATPMPALLGRTRLPRLRPPPLACACKHPPRVGQAQTSGRNSRSEVRDGGVESASSIDGCPIAPGVDHRFATIRATRHAPVRPSESCTWDPDSRSARTRCWMDRGKR